MHVREQYRQMLNYRESTDGINWPMSELNAVPFNGSTANNIVIGFAGGVGVTLDEESKDCRFKAIGTTTNAGALKGSSVRGFVGLPEFHQYTYTTYDCGTGGATWCSPDGVHWSQPRCIGLGGTQPASCTDGWNPALCSQPRYDTHNNIFKPLRDGPWVVLSRAFNTTFGRMETRGLTDGACSDM